MLYGVDVHDGYQAGLNFEVIKAQGYSFAAVKLSQGTGYVREQADEWIARARAAGLIAGAYHWLTEADGAAQARWFFRCLAAAGGPEGLLIQLDCEDDGYGPQMQAWAGEWERLTGGHPFMIYSGAWWWNAPDRPMHNVRGVDLTPYLWHSRYLSADADSVPDDPAAFAARIPASWWLPGYGGWPRATLLQFTSRGDAGGLANKVDLNCTPLTALQLLALTTTTPTTPNGDNDMPQVLVRFQDDPTEPNQVWLCDGQFRRRVKPEWVGATGKGPITNAQVHGPTLLTALGNNGAVFASLGDKDVWGIDIATLQGGAAGGGPVELTDATVAEVAEAVVDEQHDRLAE